MENVDSEKQSALTAGGNVSPDNNDSIETLRADYLRKRERRTSHEGELSRLPERLTRAAVQRDLGEVERLSERRVALQAELPGLRLAELKASLCANGAKAASNA